MIDDIPFELGDVVQDEITGFRGVVIAFAEHITGCDRVGVRPIDRENTGRRGEEEFFYPSQLTAVEDVDPISVEHEPQTDMEYEMGEMVRDTISNSTGVITTVTYRLYNCPQVALSATSTDEQTEIEDREWFDVPRVESVGDGVSGEFEELAELSDESATGAMGSDWSETMSNSPNGPV